MMLRRIRIHPWLQFSSSNQSPKTPENREQPKQDNGLIKKTDFQLLNTNQKMKKTTDFQPHIDVLNNKVANLDEDIQNLTAKVDLLNEKLDRLATNFEKFEESTNQNIERVSIDIELTNQKLDKHIKARRWFCFKF
jgi:predicted  nucleic acid-binding Zn-ribbon protein